MSTLALLVGLWVAIVLVPDPRPPTVDAAAAEVTAYFDQAEKTFLPGSVRERSEEIIRGECPLREHSGQAKIRRVISLSPAVDRRAWAAGLSAVFREADGWALRVKTLNTRENLSIRIVGRDLTLISITAVADDAGSRVIMRATSECSREVDPERPESAAPAGALVVPPSYSTMRAGE